MILDGSSIRNQANVLLTDTRCSTIVERTSRYSTWQREPIAGKTLPGAVEKVPTMPWLNPKAGHRVWHDRASNSYLVSSTEVPAKGIFVLLRSSNGFNS